MNPTSYKLYTAVCKGVTNTITCTDNMWQRSFIGRYVQYVDYLVFTRAPRLSYQEQFQAAYTPKKVQLSAPICLGLGGIVLLAESTLNAKEQAKTHFEQVRD